MTTYRAVVFKVTAVETSNLRVQHGSYQMKEIPAEASRL
jgi:hypothetical protein